MHGEYFCNIEFHYTLYDDVGTYFVESLKGNGITMNIPIYAHILSMGGYVCDELIVKLKKINMQHVKKLILYIGGCDRLCNTKIKNLGEITGNDKWNNITLLHLNKFNKKDSINNIKYNNDHDHVAFVQRQHTYIKKYIDNISPKSYCSINEYNVDLLCIEANNYQRELLDISGHEYIRGLFKTGWIGDEFTIQRDLLDTIDDYKKANTLYKHDDQLGHTLSHINYVARTNIST